MLQAPPWGLDDEDDSATTLLALASLQLEHAALDQDIKIRAIVVIDSGVGIARWEIATSKQRAERAAVLQRLRDRLLNAPLPPPEKS